PSQENPNEYFIVGTDNRHANRSSRPCRNPHRAAVRSCEAKPMVVPRYPHRVLDVCRAFKRPLREQYAGKSRRQEHRALLRTLGRAPVTAPRAVSRAARLYLGLAAHRVATALADSAVAISVRVRLCDTGLSCPHDQ